MENEIKPVPKRYRVLFLGDAKANTGFGIVTENIIPRVARILIKEWEFNICAINYWGQPYWQTENLYIFSGPKLSAMGSNPEQSKDEFGRSAFLRVLNQSNEDINDGTPPDQMGYDVIFIIQDASVACNMVPNLETIKREFKQKNKKNFKSILYFPVDNELVPRIIKEIEFFDNLVTYNEYSRRMVLRLKPELLKRIKVIPHGIDLNQFFPINNEEKKDFRKQYFGENADKFIVINLNRNQPRKDIPCTIFGFHEYRKANPNSFLYLHMNPADPKGWDLRLVLEQTGLIEGVDFMFPPLAVQNHGTDTVTLNKIYNACDVYLTTSLGEGWGLGVTEAMAAGIPVIAPLHTSFTEIGDHGKRIYALENLYPYCGSFDNVIREQCDYMEVAEKLTLVENHWREGNPELSLKLYKANEYMHTLEWDRLAKIWADMILKIF